MSLRLPQSLGASDDRAASAIETAIAAEKAASLGIAGRRLETALRKLAAAHGEADRDALIDAAADRAWAFLTQRELCGLLDRVQVIADYAIPKAVIARMGARRPQ
jgi:hypothetical protein